MLRYNRSSLFYRNDGKKMNQKVKQIQYNQLNRHHHPKGIEPPDVAMGYVAVAMRLLHRMHVRGDEHAQRALAALSGTKPLGLPLVCFRG